MSTLEQPARFLRCRPQSSAPIGDDQAYSPQILLMAQHQKPAIGSKREESTDFVFVDDPKPKPNDQVISNATQQPPSPQTEPVAITSTKRSLRKPKLPSTPAPPEPKHNFAGSPNLSAPPLPPLPPPAAGNGKLQEQNRKWHRQRQQSLNSLNSTIFQAEENSIGRLLNAVLEERERTVEQRININHQRKDLEAQISMDRAAYNEFLDLLTTIVPSILESNVADDVKMALRQKWTVFESFSSTLENWYKHLQADESELSWRVENKLLSKEEELYKRIKSIDLQLILDGDDGITDSHIPPHLLRRLSTYSTSSTSSLNSVQREYYNSIGEINLLREKIFNLESDLRIAKRKRIALEASGSPIDFSDSQFYADYFHQREDIIRRYYSMKESMEILGERCQNEGYQVEPPNLPPFLDQVFKEDADFFIELKSKRSTPRREHIHIVQWLQDIKKAGEMVIIRNEDLTEEEADGTISPSRYEQLQASTDGTTLPVNSNPPNMLRGSSFQGEVPTAGRRYSAPEIRSLPRPGRDLNLVTGRTPFENGSFYRRTKHNISRSEASRTFEVAPAEEDQLESLRWHSDGARDSYDVQESVRWI